MKKISKSELSTPEFAERAAAGAAKLAAHQATHDAMWSEGQMVWLAGRRGEIVINHTNHAQENLLTVLWEDGRVSITKPHALNR